MTVMIISAISEMSMRISSKDFILLTIILLLGLLSTDFCHVGGRKPSLKTFS